MKIKFKNFVITHSFGINKYDLAITSVMKEGKNIGKIREYPEAYGITLERAFRIILDSLVGEELAETEITFNEYLNTYNEINKELKAEIQRIEVSLSKGKTPQVNSIN